MSRIVVIDELDLPPACSSMRVGDRWQKGREPTVAEIASALERQEQRQERQRKAEAYAAEQRRLEAERREKNRTSWRS